MKASICDFNISVMNSFGGLFVKPEFFLQDKCMVDRGRQGNDLLDDYEGKDEDDRVCDLAGKSSGRKAEEP